MKAIYGKAQRLQCVDAIVGELPKLRSQATATALGALFAIAGEIVSFIIDVKGTVKAKNEGNPYAIVLGGLKVFNSLFTFGVGFNALLNLPLMRNSSLYYSIDRYMLGRAFLSISAIRVGAILSVAGSALVVLEIYLKNYVLDNAMQDWCQKCAFRLKTSAEKSL